MNSCRAKPWGVWGVAVSEVCKRVYGDGWLHDGKERGSADDGPFATEAEAQARIDLVEDNPGWRFEIRKLP